MNEVMNQSGGALAEFQAGGALAAGRNNLPASVNAGAVAIEQERAVAEAQGKLVLAKKFPRDLNGAFAELMQACKIPAFAGVAFYSKPQGGSKVTGPSVRLAEEVARVYGNFDYGHRELSRVNAGPGPTDYGRSEVEVYAWDMQQNNFSRRQITVLHVMDTREGSRKLRDQTDIDNKIANVASKQMRGRILALMPKWLVESAIEECKKTLAGQNDEPIEVRVRKMTQAFAKYGVNAGHLERYLGHTLADVTSDELVDLLGAFNAIREGAKPSEIFGDEPAEPATVPEKPATDAPAALAAKTPAPTPRPASTRRTQAPKPVEDPQPAPVESMPEPAADQAPEQEEDAF